MGFHRIYTYFSLHDKQKLSLLLVFSHESSDVFLVHVVVLVLLPLEGWSVKHLISPSSSSDVLLDLHVAVAQSWDFSSLPR